MKKTFLAFTLIYFLTSLATARPSNPGIILERYKTLLLNNMSAPKLNEINNYMKTLSRDGAWPDVDYQDKSRAAWQPARHLNRILETAFAIETGIIKPAQKHEYLEKTVLALDHWTIHRYQCDNWWFNRIGIPRTMRDIVILLGDDLKGPLRTDCIEIINQFKLEKTGANLMWSAELALHHGCLTDQTDQIEIALDKIWNEIVTTKPEGIQQDWSFFQHKERLQTFHYGLAFLDIVVKLAWQVKDTPWQMPADKQEIISQYILNGVQWMCRGEVTVPSTMDRSVSRQNSMRITTLLPLMETWKKVDTLHGEEIAQFISFCKNGIPSVRGYRHFPDADFSVYHLPEASIFLKTVSTRTLLTETTNNENLLGAPHLNCGDHYVLHTGQEYTGMQPLWDWQHLPGLTITDDNTQQIRTDFCGGLGNEHGGVTVMQYLREGETGKLAVNKLWAFHSGKMVCLLGGWELKNMENPITSLEQCRLLGPVEYCINGKSERLDKNSPEIKNMDWVLHNGIGYVPLDGKLELYAGNVSGSWGRINERYDSTPVSGDVFKLQLLQNTETPPTGYVIVPGTNRESLTTLIKNPDWQVMHNDKNAQILRFSDGIHMTAVYNPVFCSKQYPCVDKPCLMIWDDDNLWISDPTQKGGNVVISYRGKSYPHILPEKGRATRIKW